MSTTQFYALVLFYLGYIFLMQPYLTSELYSVYDQNSAIVDATVNSPNIGVILDETEPYLGQIVVTDPEASW